MYKGGNRNTKSQEKKRKEKNQHKYYDAILESPLRNGIGNNGNVHTELSDSRKFQQGITEHTEAAPKKEEWTLSAKGRRNDGGTPLVLVFTFSPGRQGPFVLVNGSGLHGDAVSSQNREATQQHASLADLGQKKTRARAVKKDTTALERQIGARSDCSQKNARRSGQDFSDHGAPESRIGIKGIIAEYPEIPARILAPDEGGTVSWALCSLRGCHLQKCALQTLRLVNWSSVWTYARLIVITGFRTMRTLSLAHFAMTLGRPRASSRHLSPARVLIAPRTTDCITAFLAVHDVYAYPAPRDDAETPWLPAGIPRMDRRKSSSRSWRVPRAVGGAGSLGFMGEAAAADVGGGTHQHPPPRPVPVVSSLRPLIGRGRNLASGVDRR
ncbi:hypothetical protein B0H13DRAFT_1919077 [Mycena leptocephala]|nr:hypothetical protein B0H13DRAFT_1919077 [Mycena leptocephala]